jgi:hypothetical protein
VAVARERWRPRAVPRKMEMAARGAARVRQPLGLVQ